MVEKCELHPVIYGFNFHSFLNHTGFAPTNNAFPYSLWATLTDFLFLGSKITADGDCSHEIKRHLLLGRKTMTNLDSPHSQSYGFSSSHEWMWELGHKEGWALKNLCFRMAVLEKTLESPLDSKIKLVNPKGNQPWIFIGRTDAEAEALILWHLMWRTDSLEKTLILGKTEGKRRRGWQRMRWLDGITDWFNVHEFEQTPGDSEEQGSLVCCSSWGPKSQTWLSDWIVTISVSSTAECDFVLNQWLENVETKHRLHVPVWNGLGHLKVLETSLLVQRLRLCPPNVGGPRSNSGPGTRFHMPQL